jgi:polyisoprenoid-binding protein YceI
MVVAKTTGRFTDFGGFIEMDPDTGTLQAIEAEIKTASVNTNHKKRNAHLCSADFFNVEKFPTIACRLTVAEGSTGSHTGGLCRAGYAQSKGLRHGLEPSARQ